MDYGNRMLEMLADPTNYPVLAWMGKFLYHLTQPKASL